MKKVIVKKVTIEDLAVMIADGRDETNELARMVARGFDSMREEMNGRFDDVDKRFDKIEGKLEKVDDRLGKVEDNLATTRMDVLGIGDRFVSKHEFSQHLVRFSLLEQRVKAKK